MNFGSARTPVIGPTLALLSLLAATGCQAPGLRSPTASERDLDARAINLLIAATRNDLPVVCANAIESLARVAPDSGRPQIRAALDHEAPLVRFAACIAVGDLRDRSCATSIRQRRADADARVRLSAAYAAYRCGDKSAGADLATALRDSPDEKIRADAAWLIGRLNDRAALIRLKNAANREQSPYVVTFIHGAMAALGDDAMLDRLIQYVLKSDNITRLIALQTLCDVSDPRAQRALLYRLNDKSDFLQTRLLAARALARLGSHAGYDLALASLSETRTDGVETRSIRCNAALALGEIGDRSALSALGNLAQTDIDEQSQVAACCAITQIVHGAVRRQ
jgi:HEAT repeat protein